MPAQLGPIAPVRRGAPIPAPQGKPVAVLQAAGFPGTITDFNDRIQAVVAAHQHAYGVPPSPFLALSVARNAQPADYPGLFSVQSHQHAQTISTLQAQKAANPDEFFVQRPDGILQPDNPLRRMILRVPPEPFKPLPSGPVAPTLPELQKKYPMVMEGALPLPNYGAVIDSLRYLDATGPQATANALNPEWEEQHAQPFDKFKLHGGSLLGGVGAVTTIKEAQQALNEKMGTTLPVTGYLNDTWVKALSNWTRSASYFQQQLQFQSQQAGFGDNVGAYIKAWHAKQKATGHGFAGHFFQAMPLPLFGHGGFWQDAGSIPAYIAGSSTNPLNIALHGLTRTAGLTLDTVGGTVSQAKADLAAGSTFAGYMIAHQQKTGTLDEALAKTRAQLHANPSWMRAFGFGAVPVNEPGWLRAIDTVTNVAGDLLLLRKASFTGERVAAGDVAAAKNSTYLNTAAGWAYRDLVKYGADGIGRASSRLEGGQGARALVARAAPLVKNGSMSREQFANHVAELYATGKTTLEFPGGRAAAVGPSAPVTGPYAGISDAELMRTRDAIESRYNKLVDQLAAGRPGDYKRVTALQNGAARKLARKGIVQPTVAEMMRDQAENELLAILKLRAGSNPAVDRAIARLDESAAISKELSLRADAALGLGDVVPHVPSVAPTAAAEPLQVSITGPLLTSLQSGKLPAPGRAGQWLLSQKHGLRDWLDNFDATAKGSNSGLVNRAGSVVTGVRVAVAHAAPQGARLGYFQDILPERVFNFVMKHQLGDDTAALANKLESDLVRFQGKENVRGIQSVEQRLKSLYHEKYGRVGTDIKDDPFQALLETEAPSVFKFPGGEAARAEDALKSIETFTGKVNAGLNKAAKIHARIILSGANPLTGLGGFSLMWKHAIGDGLRAIVAGIGTALNPETRAAKAELARLAAGDPEIARRYGALLDRLRTGEANWALNRGGWNINTESFRTGEKLGDRPYMNAAGDFLRRQLDSKALLARRDGGLVNLILHDKDFRGLWKTARKTSPDLSAEDYAALIEQRYKTIEEALAAKGASLDDATSVLRANPGHDAGPELGKWIDRNGFDFPVDHGQVETRGTFDDLTGRWVGNVIMRPNKFWRANLGETILAKHYAEFRKAGFEERQAFDVAANIAERVTKYHMLDFANRLQVEQDLRWLSYFATKHRLYWKWVLSTFARNPRYAAAVADFAHTLNQSGGITVPVPIFGQKWQIPAERLVWVPGREYTETAPLALGVWNFIRSGGSLDAAVKGASGTNGNILTRSDSATFIGAKLLKIGVGKAAATYAYARAGLDKKTADTVTRALNEYQVEFYREHGHYAPEAQAVQTVLVHQLGQEYWRANLPLPIVPENDRTDQQQLLAEYMALIDPKKRGEFLDKHPGFSDHFGVYQDPRVYLHNREFFQRWTSALDAYHSARADLYAQAKKSGEWTAALEQKRRALNAALQTTRNQLLVQDAHASGIDTKGGVPNGTTIPYGRWGKIVNKDPQFDPDHFLSAVFPKLDKSQHGDIIGPLQKSLQNELQLLNDPAYVRANVQSPEEVKTLKREILQKLEVFKAYPSDALGAIRDTYQTRYVNKYWVAYDAKVNEIKGLSSDKRAEADAAFRLWRDQQDKPVTVDGIRFPAPLRMAWATLDPTTRRERLSYLASKPVTSLADYELDLLGVKHPANTSAALAAIDEWKAGYNRSHPDGPRIHAQDYLNIAKQIDKQPGYHGFASYYVNTVAQPRVRQFMQTDLYRDAPATIRQRLDAITQAAIENIRLQVQTGNAAHYRAEWRQAVENQWTGWVNAADNKDLKAWLAPFGPNFLNQLVSR